MNVGRAVKIVGAGGGAHVNVRAAGGALLGVVHGGVDAKFFYRFGRRRGQSLTNCEIGRGGALDDCSAAAGGAADAGVVYDASGGDLAGAFAIEEVAGVNAVEEKTVAGIALTVGPDGLIAESAVGARAAGEFRIHARGKKSEAGEAAGGQGDGLDLILFEDVAVGGVLRIHEGRGFHGNGGADLADFESYVYGCGAIRLHGDGRNFLGFEAVVGEGEGVGTDGKIYKFVDSGAICFLLGAGEFGGVGDQGDLRVREGAAGGVGDCAGDATECLLRAGVGSEKQRQGTD